MSLQQPKICVVGSSNTDMIVRVERIPRPGETVIGGVFSTAAGGKGANQAVAAARAGGKVRFVARLGRDTFGDQALEGLRADGIDVAHVTRDTDQASGVALIFVGENGENSIAVASGANGTHSPDDIRAASASIKDADVLLVQLETPVETVRAALQEAGRAGVTTILNPAPAQPLDDHLLSLVSVLTPNESEAEELAGQPVRSADDAEAAARSLLEKVKQAVVITLGSRGALVCTNSLQEWVKPHDVEAVDSTAAGDAFNGALAVALAEGRGLIEAVAFANAAGALAVTKLGAQPSAPRRQDIQRLMEEGQRIGQ